MTSDQARLQELDQARLQELDQARLEEFLARFGADAAAAMHAATVVLGHRLGLYRSLADGGPQTAPELAERSGCQPRLVREWLDAQAASGYCAHDPDTERYWLTAEQAACLAHESSPTFVVGGMLAANVVHLDEEKVRGAFAGDGSVGWHEHHHDLFTATERAFRGPYQANLVTGWVPALDGVADRLHAGARVADVGCGFGSSTILLARAFPASTFCGFDYHAPSIEAAREAAAAAGVSDRVTFEIAAADGFPGTRYDLICMFNALHEMGDPVGVTRHVREALTGDGSLMIVEPFASDRVEDNRTPVGRNFYSVSTMVCVPNALSQGEVRALGAQAGEAALQAVVTRAGFTRFRRAAETPLNLVLEAKP